MYSAGLLDAMMDSCAGRRVGSGWKAGEGKEDVAAELLAAGVELVEYYRLDGGGSKVCQKQGTGMAEPSTAS